MIARLFEAITGRAWTTTRSCTTEFGPPPGAVYAEQLAAYSDTELLTHGETILAHLRATDRHATGAGVRGPATPHPPPRAKPGGGARAGAVPMAGGRR